ncbi:MAG TPA: 50S ribosomal protein L32e [Candidatus Saccharimonadales bacterium]|nr:50S ribosomal protein L32e [Candidatus Saccharimonadales bacterium]
MSGSFWTASTYSKKRRARNLPKTYRRPTFVREESWRYKRVKPTWRSPRGKTSRVRRSKDGWPPVVKIGYSRAKATRHLHPSGLREILIWRPQDLENINSSTTVVRIGHTVGENKRNRIIEEAKKKNLRVLNPGVKRQAQEAKAEEEEAKVDTVEAEAEVPQLDDKETKPQ